MLRSRGSHQEVFPYRHVGKDLSSLRNLNQAGFYAFTGFVLFNVVTPEEDGTRRSFENAGKIFQKSCLACTI